MLFVLHFISYSNGFVIFNAMVPVCAVKYKMAVTLGTVTLHSFQSKLKSTQVTPA